MFIAGGNLYFLGKYIALLDVELSNISSAIAKTIDPEANGLYDYGEYIAGYGFMAFQQYMTSTYPHAKGCTKRNAFDVGPVVKNTSVTYASILNAGANYWKHQEEWGLKNIISRNTDELPDNARNTILLIEKITPWDDYTCVNLLAAMTGGDLVFSPILSKISEWANNLELMVSSHQSR